MKRLPQLISLFILFSTSSLWASPAAPTGLDISSAAGSSIILEWIDNSSDESGFRIYRSTDGVSFKAHNAVSSNATNYTDRRLVNGRTYYYRVASFNSVGTSTVSNTATATVGAGGAAPDAPSGLSATTASSTQIDLSWTDNSANENTFRIERSPNGSDSWAEITAVGSNVTTYSDTGLSASTTYYYRVRARNAAGNSSYTATANDTTDAAPPTAPSGLSATATSSTQIDLAWTDNSGDETSFRIERSPNGTDSWVEIDSTAANATSYENTGLTASTTYYYRVRARNAAGDSSYTSVANDTTDADAGGGGSNSVSINNGSSTTATTYVLLSLDSEDYTSEMYVTNTSGCSAGGAWQNYSSTLLWTLGTASGTATVYAKFRDSGLNESPCVSDTITVDNGAPDAPSFSGISPASPNASTTPVITGTIVATDIQSISLFDSDSCFKTIGTGSRADYVGTGITATIPLNQTISIYARAIDTSGNASTCSFQTTYTNSASNAGTWRSMREPTGLISDFPYAVWTGSEMFVSDFYLDNRAGLYNPITDSWRPVSTTGAPSIRDEFSMVWTGSEVIVWGGYDNRSFTNLQNGARYNPLTDTWTAMTTTNAPAARQDAVTVWTGTEMIVWGGNTEYGSTAFNTGSRYNPDIDSWTTITTTNAPSARFNTEGVWTGTEMIVWGGYNTSYTQLGTGARYNPLTDTWTTMTTTDAPSARANLKMVWTGNLALVWGGSSGTTGGRYNPATDTWTTITSTNSPTSNSNISAIWTGERMIAYGGNTGPTSNLGGSYNPDTDTWTAIASATSGSRNHVALWTGSQMIVFGGVDPSGIAQGLAEIYTPGTDSWTEPSSVFFPTPRWSHFAVWTGSEMFVWAGTGGGSAGTLRDGGLYDPTTNSWSTVSTTNAPAGGVQGSIVWTGTEAIMWGGLNLSSSRVNTGARYNPVSDTWTATTTTGAPTARGNHSAIWADDVMIIWGGNTGSNTNTGSRYDPVGNTWSATTTTGAPAARSAAPAVWTGSEMIVWGGGNSTLNTGGRYDPAGNTWSATTTTGAPTARRSHKLVWTGTEMIVHGGTTTATVAGGTNTGGRYDPVGDSWTATTTTGAPTHQDHFAAWTGSHLIVWGGRATTSDAISTGALYDPDLDSWATITTTGAPTLGVAMNGVWANIEMIVWGGISTSEKGGIYTP
jgi:N-acetylneuraminic acid mutarotase